MEVNDGNSGAKRGIFMRKLLVALTTIALVVTGVQAGNATDSWSPIGESGPIEVSNPKDRLDAGFHNLYVLEQAQPMATRGFYRIGYPREKYTFDTLIVCPDVGPRLDCGTGKSGRASGDAMLPVCGTEIESCIEKVWIYEAGQIPAEAQFVRSLRGETTKGYALRGIPRGSTAAIWKGAKAHTGGDEYVAQASIGFSILDGQIDLQSLELSVIPTAETSSNMAGDPKFIVCAPPNLPEGQVGVCGSSGNNGFNVRCAYTQQGVCGSTKLFAENTRVAVQLRLPNQISGWFHGRMKSPDIQVTKINDMYNMVKVDASPVQVGRFFTQSRPDLGDPKPQDMFDYMGRGGPYTIFGSNSQDAFTILSKFRDRAKDTANGVSTLWSVSTIPSPNSSGSGQCLADTSRVLGIVTTNAAVYYGRAPEFRNGFLNYEVAGMHYLPGGIELSQGSYDLVMRSDLARCLYGFSNAPLSASVSVVNSKGQKSFATTVVNEKNGWLKMAAYGFTFSKKVIKVKITKAKKKKR
jgi:hypothetical protein